MGEVWYREKIEITIHHVIVKYLVHSVEWGVAPPTMGYIFFINILAIPRYHIL
jgi:hypothetical protein